MERARYLSRSSRDWVAAMGVSQIPADRHSPVKSESGGRKKFNLALKNDKSTGRWFVDGGW